MRLCLGIRELGQKKIPSMHFASSTFSSNCWNSSKLSSSASGKRMGDSFYMGQIAIKHAWQKNTALLVASTYSVVSVKYAT